MPKTGPNVLDLTEFIPSEIMVGEWNRYKLVIAGSGETIPVGYQSKNKPKELNVPDMHIGIYFSYRPFHRHEIDRYIAKILPRFIPYNGLARQVIGLLKAEMGKSLGRKNCIPIINFSNSSPAIMAKVLDWFERLGVKRMDWGWYVKLNLKFRNEPQEIAQLAPYKEFWKRVAGLAEEMAHPKYCTFGGTLDGTLCLKSPAWGTAVIERSDSILRTILLRLVSELGNKIEEKGSEREVADYLSGILGGESTIYWSLSPQGHGAKSIRISAPSSNDRDHYSECLTKLGIKAHEINRGLQISGLDNFLKVFDLKLMNADPRRELEFLRMLLTYTPWRYSSSLWKHYCELKPLIERKSAKLQKSLGNLKAVFAEHKLSTNVGGRRPPINPRKARLQYTFLELINKNPGISLSEILGKFNLHPRTVKRVLAALVKKNLISQDLKSRFFVSCNFGIMETESGFYKDSFVSSGVTIP